MTLTARARRVVGQLAAKWRATEDAVAEIEAEIPYPLSRVVTDIERALLRRSFRDRISERLARDPAWKSREVHGGAFPWPGRIMGASDFSANGGAIQAEAG